MLPKIKNLALSLIAATGLLFILSPPIIVAAVDCNDPTTITTTKAAIKCGSDNVSGNTKTDAQANAAVNSTIINVINILSATVGIVAVIMIILGGFRYITSAGDTSKVSAAKNTIMYALIGLVIVAISQVIVRFVLTKATKIG